MGSPPTRNRVAVYFSNRDIRLEMRPVPPLGPGEVLLRVHASGICGSDLMEWYRRPKAPTVLGHEVAGQIVAAGDRVRRFHVGDRVVATHHVPCLECRYCRSGRETTCEMFRQTNFDPGGFAEWVRLPAVNVERGTLKLPDHVSDDAGSLVEPLGCALRAQRKAGLGSGESVLIVGAGVSGSLHLLAAKARGMGPVFVSDIQPARRAMAARLGADHVYDAGAEVADEIRRELGHGVDCVIACTGARDAIALALEAADRGGTVIFFAPMGPEDTYPLPFNRVFWRHQVTLCSSYGAAPADLEQALHLIAGGGADIGRLVTHRLPLGEIQNGFEMMLQARDSLKIIIDPRLDA